MHYPVPLTVTASERLEWKRIAATLALCGDEPLTGFVAQAAIPTPSKKLYLVDPRTEQLLSECFVGQEHSFCRLNLTHMVMIAKNNRGYRSTQATYERLNPDDPDCVWYFWVGGERWWEPVDN